MSHDDPRPVSRRVRNAHVFPILSFRLRMYMALFVPEVGVR